MLGTQAEEATIRSGIVKKEMLLPLAVLGVQLIATSFFAFDSVSEWRGQLDGFASPGFAIECFIALALLGGIVISFRYIVRLKRELSWQGQSLARAKGVLNQNLGICFRAWGLTPGESEVAMFALKGFGVAEIAGLRNSAPGTIRSQLSQIYKKAGVSGHAELIAWFIDDLLEISEAWPADRISQARVTRRLLP